ncbi:MAG: cysteine--tRNA ligase [Patescibacteria group bacterium]
MVLKIYNTLTHQKEEFTALKTGKVSFYYCGPTVYWRQHIGGLRGAVCADIVRRSFEYLGYAVNFVSNYTDVGHLTSDEDSGEDKMEKGAKREGKTPQEIATKYIALFEEDSKVLNILPPTRRCRATAYIPEMIAMAQSLLEKDFAYATDLAIYFDVSKAKNYTQLSGQKIEEQIAGAGGGNIEDKQKKHPADFALWFFKAGSHKNALQFWQSPFQSPLVQNGEGFPGWHIECSAMAKKYLGDTLDAHMGGIEHISVHHTNEIAQSESANGVKFVNFWLHNEHLVFNGEKMSKSLRNVVVLDDLRDKKYNPLALRFLFLQAHYRSKQNFSWEALGSAQNGLDNLYKQIGNLGDIVGEISTEYKQAFTEKLSDDFNTPQAVVVLQKLLKSELPGKDKLATVLDFDKVLGLNLKNSGQQLQQELNFEELPSEIQNLIKERETTRQEKDWNKADKIREELQKKNYFIKDTDFGTQIFRMKNLVSASV